MAGRTSVDDTAGPPAGARGLPGPIEPNGDTATTPARFSGRVFVGGRPAVVGGAVCGQAKATVDGPAAYFLLDVASAATRAGCGTDGAEIDFSVGDATAKERAVFRGGSTTQLDLHVETGGVDAAASAEVALHEVGASVAATIAGVQQELARYPIALG